MNLNLDLNLKSFAVFLNILLAGVLCMCAAAEKPFDLPLTIDGQWIQGAMLKGNTVPGAEIELLGKKIDADESGDFVFGLGRDIKGPVKVVVSLKGNREVFEYPVEQRQYDIQRIEGVDKKYVSPPEEVLERIRLDAKRVRAARSGSSELKNYSSQFVIPAEGPITGVYGSQRVFNGVPKRPHYGLDVAGAVGTPVIAPAGGVVTLADKDLYYSGGTLIVDHGKGISSTFIHLSELLVKEGEVIEQGQLIARIGATGRVTGPHLDWRVNWFEHRLDPQLLLQNDPKP